MASFTKPGLSHHTTLGGTGISIDRTDQGSLLIGDGEGFKLNTLVGGTGINIVNGDGTITISVTAAYSLPIASASVLGGIKIGSGLSIDPMTGVLSSTAGVLPSDIAYIDVTNTFSKKQFIDTHLIVGSDLTLELLDHTDAASLYLTALGTGNLLEFHSPAANYIIDTNANVFMGGTFKQYNNTGALDGQLLIGNTSGGRFDAAVLTAGSNITITNGPGTITIDSTGGGGGSEAVDHNGSLIGTRPTINFIDGSNVTLTVADNSGSNSVDVTIASTGGGGGSGTDVDGKILIQSPNASSNAKDDEFNDGVGMSGPINGLNAKWTKHNLGTPAWLVFDDTKAPGCLVFNIADGQPNDQSIYQTTPAGDFTVMAIIEPVTFLHREMWYVFIVDTGGNGVGFGYDNQGEYSIRQMSAWQQTGTRNIAYGVNGLDYPQQIWLKKVGNTYTGAVGFVDRYRLMPATHSANLSFSFTAAFIGFGRIYNENNGTSNIFLLDAFRVT